MDKLIVIATLFAELLAMLICWYSIFKKPIKIDFYFCGLIIIEIVIMFLIYYKNISRNFLILEYSIIFIYFWCRFKMSIIKTSLNFLYGLTISGLMEIVIAIPYVFLRSYINGYVASALASWAMLLVMYFISTKISNSIKVIDIKKDKKIQLTVVLYSIMEITFFLVGIIRNIHIKVSTLIIGSFIFLGYLYLSIIINIKVELETKNYELRLNKIYGDAYIELISNIRKRQHDFKNQLGAIYSMHMTASSLEDLISMQQNYCEKLIENCKFDAILTNCNNKILAGYLYNKFLEVENKGINIEYQINTYNDNKIIQIHELIEILGILINNAYEETIALDCGKEINISIIEDIKNLSIKVCNPSKWLNSSEIENMFNFGISSKGENRGIGLARVKELSILYGADIKVENFKKNNQNFIVIEILFEQR